MSKLFIIGNGFDLAHGFSTSYNNFKEWMCENFNAKDYELIKLPQYNTNYKRIEVYDESMAKFFYYLICDIIGENWSDFEYSLSSLNWYSAIKETLSWDSKGIDIINDAEAAAFQLRDCAHVLIDDYFPKWVRQIDISSPLVISKELKSLITDDDYFLTFNYTDTLEQYYGVDNICHIHGQSSKNDRLIVGHGNETWNVKLDEDPIFDGSQVFSYIEAINNGFRKDTSRVLSDKIDFFNSLENITDVYIYGFSFSLVDMYYISRLRYVIQDEDIVFHIHSYDKKDLYKYFEEVRKAGFTNNKIKEFEIKDLT